MVLFCTAKQHMEFFFSWLLQYAISSPSFFPKLNKLCFKCVKFVWYMLVGAHMLGNYII